MLNRVIYGWIGMMALGLIACDGPTRAPTQVPVVVAAKEKTLTPKPGVLKAKMVVNQAVSSTTTDTRKPHIKASTCVSQSKHAHQRWLDSNPHTPMAMVTSKAITAPDNACCIAWGDRATSWTEIDAYGRDVNTARIIGGEWYDVTRCYEFKFDMVKPLSSRKGVGLYVSGAPRLYEAARPYLLSVNDIKAHKAIVQPLYKAFKVTAPDQATLAFYLLSAKKEAAHSEDAQVCAAYGGALFALVCKATAKGRGHAWRIVYLEHALLSSFQSVPAMRWANTFNRPLAAVDMNGDGVVEVIVHQNEGSAWWDTVVQFQSDDSAPWKSIITSPGGATI